jgi:DNA-binding beta-propeller fold protein YncE
MRHAAAFILAVLIAPLSLLAQQPPLVLLGAIELPGVEGRIDHLAVDIQSQRLFVAALGNDSVEVGDLRTNRHVSSLKGFREPQGILVIPTPATVVVASGQGANVQFVRAADLAIAKTTTGMDDADNVRFDLIAGRVYVGYGSGALGVIDAKDGKRLGNIPLAGHPESFQLEKAGPRIFVNVPSAGHTAVVNRQTMKVDATWPVTQARSNYPMALDEDGRRLFIGCRQPAKVLIIDTSSGKTLASFDTVGDTDDLFYDAGRRRLYVSGGEGFLDVFQERAGGFGRTQHLSTVAGARTALFVPEMSRLYLAVPHRGAQRAEVRIYEVHDQ